MAASSAFKSLVTLPVFKASITSPKTWVAHIATLRVDMGTCTISWVMWAKNRFSAAAAIAVQISPSTIAGFSVAKACKLA